MSLIEKIEILEDQIEFFQIHLGEIEDKIAGKSNSRPRIILQKACEFEDPIQVANGGGIEEIRSLRLN